MSTQHPPETFIRTYKSRSYADPVDSVTDYQRVLEYASLHPNKGSSAVAAHFEMPRGRVRSWMDGSKPDAVRGVEVAREHGWLAVDDEEPDADQEMLDALTRLIAWVFSGGSINAHWVPSFIVDDADQERAVLDLLAAVDIGGEVVERGSGRATEVVPSEDASVLGRVLYSMGAPAGEKNADADVTLPEWLWYAPADVRRSFVDVYLANRGYVHDDKDTVTLREERSDGYLDALARFIADVAGADVRRNDKNVVVTAEAARQLGIGRP